MSGPKNEPPAPSDPPKGHGSAQGGNHLYVKNLHYSANDIAELRKMAESNPELAEKIVDHKDRADAREARGFQLGLVLTVSMVIAIVGIGSWAVVNLGWWQSILLICVILAASHVVVAILKGEFSETSWLGKIISGQRGGD